VLEGGSGLGVRGGGLLKERVYDGGEGPYVILFVCPGRPQSHWKSRLRVSGLISDFDANHCLPTLPFGYWKATTRMRETTARAEAMDFVCGTTSFTDSVCVCCVHEHA